MNGMHDTGRRRSAGAGARRLTLVEAIIIGGLIALLVAAALSPAWRAKANPISECAVITVAEHDTLWEIAAAHPAPGRSVAATVDAIVAMNGLESSVVHPGQTLRVPAIEHVGSAVAQR